MRADRLRLLDALEQIELIRTFSDAGRETFFGDILTQSAILHRLALLGEACRGLSPQLRQAHTEIPWNPSLLFAMWWSTNTLASTSISSGQSLPSKPARLAPR
jgi:hypothetical protein